VAGGFDRKPGGSSLVNETFGERGSQSSPGKRTLTEQLSLQMKAAGATSEGSPAPAEPTSGGGAAMPAPVQAKMEHAFGEDFSAVRVHEGAQAGAMGALAYTQGADIHFAPGQYQPHGGRGQELLGHELAHVVQQRQGRVAPTAQAKGVDLNDDPALEREADDIGQRAAHGETIAPGSAGRASQSAAPATQRKSVAQLKGEPTVRMGSTGASVRILQQRLNAKEVVEPPLKIDGIFGPKTKAAVVAFQTGRTGSDGKALDPDGVAGKFTWGAVNDERDVPEIATTDDAIGSHIAAEMNNNNNDPHEADRGVHYDFNYKASFPAKWKDDYSNGFADPQYFVRLGWMDWRLKPKMSASAAIQAWLHGLTIAECNSAIIAIQTDAVRASIGDEKFDQKFGATDKEIPEAQRMRIKTGSDGTVVEGLNKPTEGAAAHDAGTFGHRPVKKGDWCYFYNHPKYLLKHPGGAFQGENSIFMGTDPAGLQIWSGMGVNNATEQDMLLAMIGAYNNPRDEFDMQAIERIKTANGGVVPSKYDEASGEFPATLTNPSEILDAPAYELNGRTRKGGYLVDNPIRLDTTKVAALGT
jgi:hypothetical protein